MSTYCNNAEDSKPIGEIADKNIFQKISIYIQTINDKLLYYRTERWSIAGLMFFAYIIRVFFILGGYFALSYCIGIHVLNSFLGFISPIDDPEDEESEESYLPQK